MGILGSEYQWAHVEWCQPRIPWSQLKRKGGKGSSRASFAKEEGESKWYGLYQGSYEVPSHRQSLFIPGASTSAGHTRSSTSSSREVVINIPWFIPGHGRFPCLYQVIGDSLFTPGEASYSHQWPLCGERFLGLNTPEERFLGRLREWRLGERDPRLWDDSGQRVSSNCPGSGMSTTVGGRSARCRAASMASHVSGRAAAGKQYLASVL